MEVNILFFIPLVIFLGEWNQFNILGLKYFFIQSLASIFLLVRILFINLILLNNFYVEFFIIGSILWKMGAPPFHLWLVNLMIDLEWFIFFVISSLQKVLPLYILRKIPLIFLDILIILSLLVRLSLSLIQSRVKKILIISSIFTGAWIFAALIFLKFFWVVILFVYSVMLLRCIVVFIKNKTSHKSRGVVFSITLIEKLTMFIILIAVAGLPPLTGFYLKLVVICGVINLGNIIIASALLFSSVLIIYIYRGIFLLALSNQAPNSVYLSSFRGVNFVQYFRMSLIISPLLLLLI